jgi:hypothetical protein
VVLGPDLLLIVMTPVILPVAVVINWRVRRLAGVRAWATSAPRRYAIVAASLVISAVLVWAGYELWRALDFQR